MLPPRPPTFPECACDRRRAWSLRSALRLIAALGAFSFGASLGAAPAEERHALYVVASINSSSRVMGGASAALDGIYRRGAGETEFRHVGINLPLLTALALDPRDARLIYAAGLSGVMRSRDGGQTWRIVTGWDETEPKAVQVDPHAPDTVYAGLPDGFIVSHDQGQTWQRAERGLPARGKYTQCLQVDRTRRGRLLIGCETGIYLSEDGAQSWRRVFATVDTVNDLRQSPHDPAHWVAVSQSAGALESRDGGASWTELAGLPRDRALYNVAFHPRRPGTLAVASWSYGMWVSTDDGRTWAARNAGLPAPARVWRTAFDPDDGRLYAAVVEQALHVSEDLGLTWTEAGLPGSIIRDFVFGPSR